MTSKNAILSFRFTWENIDELKGLLWDIHQSLNKRYNDIFCSLFKEEYFKDNQLTTDQIYQYCIDQQANKKDYIAYIRKKEQSKWMNLELGKAIELQQRIIVLIQKWLQDHHKEFLDNAQVIVEFDSHTHLLSILDDSDNNIL